MTTPPFGSPGSAGRAAVAALLLALCYGAHGQDGDDGEDDAQPDEVTASAVIRSCDSQRRIGRALLRERPSTEAMKIVDIVIDVRRGLTGGKHGVHIHETGACEPCSAAGGHFDPGPYGHSNPDANHPFHAGELVNLNVDKLSGYEYNSDGQRVGGGTLWTLTTRITLSDGPLSLFDEDGSALIIHTNTDTGCPDGEAAGCAGGGRDACGVIVKDVLDDA